MVSATMSLGPVAQWLPLPGCAQLRAVCHQACLQYATRGHDRGERHTVLAFRFTPPPHGCVLLKPRFGRLSNILMVA